MAKPEIEIEKIDALRNAFNAMMVSHQQINVGDIVILHPANPGFFQFPEPERPGIVTEFLPKPLRGFELANDMSPATPATAMLYDCVIHIIDEDGDVVPFLMDSRRLQKVG